MRTRMRTAVVTLAAAGLALLGSGVADAQETGSVGTSFNDRLFAGQYIENGIYRFEMQTNGDLVLWAGSRACWTSGTAGIPKPYAKYNESLVGPPFLQLVTDGGPIRTWNGSYTWTHKTGNVSLNSKGEVWIAYLKFIAC